MGGRWQMIAPESLTYGALNRRANALAWELAARGARAEVPVGIFIDRSPELIVAILAVLKTGAAYVPLDPDYPAERLAYMVENAQAPLLITRRGLQETCPPSAAEVVLVDAERPERSRELCWPGWAG